ncbi:AAA family ATPase [uncultured Roseibium sp.]|uniref:AAA family ATPase n=1 Tax=uncultured Roseibium sp. TaxID=1936171 RepID=UPI00260A50DA|nr:AAA family ATPase [uncultured Roseibium sp.]
MIFFDISEWLKSIGLERYAPLFREQEIDFEVLLHLSEEDLKEIGLPLGPRRLILSKIAQGVGSFTASTGYQEAGSNFTVETATDIKPQHGSAERRRIAIAFFDMVDSTPLAVRLDPEELRDVTQSFLERVRTAILRYDGYVARYLGDGILAFFGWPEAFEDQAERAARAALDSVAAVRELQFDSGLQLDVRVGIATGLVVVGDHGHRGADVSGDTPNRAQRLQSIASPGQIVIDRATQVACASTIATESLGSMSAKGFPEPLPVWRVTGVERTEETIEASPDALTPFVGREHEYGMLLDRWETVRSGEGQLMLLTGEAGIGKSRLVRMLQSHLAGEAHTLVRLQCIDYQVGSAFYPIAQFFRDLARITTGDDDVEQRRKLEASTSEKFAATPKDIDLISQLVLRVDPSVSLSFTSADDAYDQIVDAIISLVQRAAAAGPLLIVVEDAHWIDPSTEDVLRELASRLENLPIMLLVAKRPGWQFPGSAHTPRTELTLNRVTRDQALEIAAANGGDGLGRVLVRAIVERAGGVPLYVEELTKAMIQSPDKQELPDSVQALFVARLDSLGQDKELAQILSVLGRSFDRQFIEAVNADADLDESLQRVEASGLVVRQGSGAKAVYGFKHALIQEVAYETLLHSVRRKVHSRVADVLMMDFSEVAKRQPEITALHLSRSERHEEAAACYLDAGQRFASHSAHIEAVEQYKGGLRSLGMTPQTQTRDGAELDLRIGLGASLLMKEGWSAPEVEENYDVALTLSRHSSDNRKLFVALRGQANVHFLKGELRKTRSIVEQLIAMAEDDRSEDLLIEAYRSNGMCSVHEAEFERAVEYLTRANDLYDRVRHADLKFTYGTDPGVVGMSGLSWAHWLLGNLETAEAYRDRAIALGKKLDHPFSLIYAEGFAACLAQFKQDAALAMTHADSVISMSEEQDYPYWTGWGRIVRGWAIAVEGDISAGLVELAQGIATYRGTGATQILPYAEFLVEQIKLIAGLQAHSQAPKSFESTLTSHKSESCFFSELSSQNV